MGEPPFLTRANGGHQTWKSARVFNPVGQRPGGPMNWSSPPGRCEGFARLPAGRKAVTGGGKKRASRATMACVPIDKKEGHPAVKPDTLRID